MSIHKVPGGPQTAALLTHHKPEPCLCWRKAHADEGTQSSWDWGRSRIPQPLRVTICDAYRPLWGCFSEDESIPFILISSVRHWGLWLCVFTCGQVEWGVFLLDLKPACDTGSSWPQGNPTRAKRSGPRAVSSVCNHSGLGTALLSGSRL